ncbi:MAG: non-canonical purine NTP pyrophosphatase [Gemmobacter sp.]
MTRGLKAGRLLVATHNTGKVEEFRRILEPKGIEVLAGSDLGLRAPAETENSFEGNARVKAVAAAAATGLPALADDSGLAIDALGGRPGIHTADWAEIGGERDFGHAMRRAHEELSASGAPEPWACRFVCALALCWPDGHCETFVGTVEGTFVWPPRGVMGHGYDPVFVPAGRSRTFAEMSAAEKDAISHRSSAIAALLARCFT